MSKKLNHLLPCPFCGKTDSLVLWNGNTEEYELSTPQGANIYEEDNCTDSLCIVCDVFKYGCGASSGFSITKVNAIAKWQKRTNQ